MKQWLIILISPWDNSAVLVPTPYPTLEECRTAIVSAVPVGHGFEAKGYCVPSPSEPRGEETKG